MQKQNHFTHLVLIVWVDLMTCSASVQTPPCMKCSIASGSMSAILPLIQCGSGNTGHTAQCPCTELEPTSLQWKPVHNKKGDSRSHSAPQCPAHQKQGEVKELKLSDRLKYRVMYALFTQLKISNIVRIWHIVSERSTRYLCRNTKHACIFKKGKQHNINIHCRTFSPSASYVQLFGYRPNHTPRLTHFQKLLCRIIQRPRTHRGSC